MAVSFTPAQYQALLAPLSPHRVASRQAPGGGQRLSYLEAWDVKRFLIRIFGFDGWSSEVLEAEHVFTQETTIGQNKRTGYHVGYKVRLRLTIFNETGPATIFTEAAVGSATLPVLGDAHDMAVKTAESDALKRAATHLGDQFGLSLYNGGSQAPVVNKTLKDPEGSTEGAADTAHVDAPVAAPEDAAPVEPAPPMPGALEDSPGGPEWYAEMRAVAESGDVKGIIELKQRASKENVLDFTVSGKTLAAWFDVALVQARKVAERTGKATETGS